MNGAMKELTTPSTAPLIKIRTLARSETAKAAVGLSDELTAGFSDELKIDTKSHVPREDIQQVRSPTGSTGIPLLRREFIMTGKSLNELRERLDEVSRRLEADVSRGRSDWFGFRAPVHSYDPPNVKFDILNRNAWEYFCYLQMTSIELDECMRISVWNEENHYPLVVHGVSPELRSQAEEFDDRRRQLEMTAQDRAEKLDRKNPEAYLRWKEFYKQLEAKQQIEEACGESAESANLRPEEGMRLLWKWRLKVFDVYRRCEKEEFDNAARS
jgi:hypothetical protein